MKKTRKSKKGQSKKMNQEITLRTKILTTTTMVVLLVMVGVGVFFATRPVEKETAVTEPSGAQSSLVAGNCNLTDKLVNPCRPHIGAISASYGYSGWEGHILGFEKRAGRKIDVAHNYRRADSPSLSSSDIKMINRGTLLYLNWKPDNYWRNAGGKNAAVNARIDRMARSIKSVSPKKLFLTIYHEPENDLSAKGSKCSRHVGNKGTTAEYRAMWKNVRARFDAAGVKNMVWLMNYMGWSGWDCAVKDLWPGNNLVDWITWDPYTNDKGNFLSDMTRFQTFLTKNSDAKHAFTSKPWGIGEMGFEGHSQAKAYKYYDDMASAIINRKLPNLHMYLFFDENGKDFGGDPGWDSRIGYARSGAKDAKEQQRFNAMFAKVAALNKPSSQSDTQPPKVSMVGPAPTSAISGKVNFAASATDNKAVKAISFVVNNKWVATDSAAPYTFQLDTRKYPNGKHTMFFRAWDYNENRADTKTITITIKN